jgi:hypothetical protein
MVNHRKVYIEPTYGILGLPVCTQLRDWMWDAERGCVFISTRLQLQAGTGSFSLTPFYSIEKLAHETWFLV